MKTEFGLALCIKWIKTVAMREKEKIPMHVFASMALLLVSVFVSAAASSQAELDWESYWPDDDDKIIDAINEGELTFLDKPPNKPVHHHHNIFIIHKSSIETGWIKLQQCHKNLDTFRRAQIVYNEGRIRNLQVTEHSNIAEARVEGHTVQLTDVKDNARLCIEAESRALIAQEDGSFVLQNGPFMRKFLDGYFPMRVSIDIKWPGNLSFVAIEPVEQKGFSVTTDKQRLQLDSWFEGRLVTRIRFKPVPDPTMQ
jgi:hypothetical protein